jgi:hypothetical protein
VSDRSGVRARDHRQGRRRTASDCWSPGTSEGQQVRVGRDELAGHLTNGTGDQRGDVRPAALHNPLQRPEVLPATQLLDHVTTAPGTQVRRVAAIIDHRGFHLVLLRVAGALEVTLAQGIGPPPVQERGRRRFGGRHQPVAGYQKQGATVVKGAARLTGGDSWRVDVAAGSSPRICHRRDRLPTGPAHRSRALTTCWYGPTGRPPTCARSRERVVMIGGSALGVGLGQSPDRMGARVSVVQPGPELLDRAEPV